MGTMQDDLLIPFSTYFKPIKIGEPSQLQVQCEYQGKKYDRRLLWKLDPHMAYKKSLSLGYSPSPWYTGGSNTALVDGIMGSIDFRDGHWQAVQGKDMTMIIDLGKDTLIRSVSTQWYMYSNAWIFVPERIEIWGSKEGESWHHLNTEILNEDLQHAEQHIRTLEQQLENSVYRFIKVVAVNQGACPEWHEAAGEPSWLFCDEIIVH
jgi:hexosaminidase